MTVHARQLARLCRERLAAQQELPVFKQQPEQQHAAVQQSAAVQQPATDVTPDATETGQPVS
jgi:hypothetical protein